MDRKVYSVSRIIEYLRAMVREDLFCRHTIVRGEISDVRYHSASGHTYFILREGDNQLSCILYAGDRRGQSILPEDGRAPSELLKRRFRQRKPRFIRKVSELPASAKDVEDVEVRRVFVEEVTKAQIAAEEERDRMREMMVIAQASAAESDRLREEAEAKRDLAMELARGAVERAKGAVATARGVVDEVMQTAREATEQAFAAAAVEIEFARNEEHERAD